MPAARRPRTRRTSGRSRPTLAARGLDVTRVARGVARVPRVRAHGHDGGQRLPAPGVPRVPRTASPTLADEVLVMTSAGGLVPVGRRRRAPGGAAAVAARPAACWPRPRVAAANGFPDAITFDMGGTSTDVCLVLDGRPAPAAERDGRRAPGAAAVARRPHHRRRRRIDRPHRRRRRAGRRAPQRRRRARAGLLRPRRHRADGHRRRPRRRPHPRRRRVPRPRPARRRRGPARARRGRRRPPRACIAVVDADDGAGAAGGVGRARRRPARRWRSSPSAAPDRCTPARWPTRSACRR